VKWNEVVCGLTKALSAVVAMDCCCCCSLVVGVVVVVVFVK
jgi:hypothetical protein